ncbi:MAG: DUF4145 domain-containing protein [Actinomycetota bacterium]
MGDQGPVKKELLSYCRQCGGDRHHSVVAETTRTWDDEHAPVYGGDTWAILECGGCRTITFAHNHWFSEDFDWDESGPVPTIHRDLYPPAPPRKMPEWGVDGYICYNIGDLWVSKLHQDVYSAIGLKAFSLAAMGTRAIVDFVVTSKAGDSGDFRAKLRRLCGQGLITETQVEVIYAAFDAGSAAAHRGYNPAQEDVFTLLDITESLLHQIYIAPLQRDRQAKAAEDLKARTPPRRP